VDGRNWRGAAIDVLSLAYAHDADRSASFGEHRQNFGLRPVELPLNVDIENDVRGVDAVACATQAIHELVIVLDQRSADWFTTPTDRAEERGRLDLCRTASPGSIATQLLLRTGLTTPLVQFDLLDEETDQ
jgi:hypothetical protein